MRVATVAAFDRFKSGVSASDTEAQIARATRAEGGAPAKRLKAPSGDADQQCRQGRDQTRSDFLSKPCTAFDGDRLLSAGPLIEVALAVKTAIDSGRASCVLTFDDSTGAIIELDLRGSKADVIAHLSDHQLGETARSAARDHVRPCDGGPVPAAPRRRGRPKLGVVAREVTLLPSHWSWLAAQKGGASVTLRRLVEQACRVGDPHQQERRVQDNAYRFVSAVGSNRPGFEEAARALYAGSYHSFAHYISVWPADLKAYALQLALGAGAITPKDIAASTSQPAETISVRAARWPGPNDLSVSGCSTEAAV